MAISMIENSRDLAKRKRQTRTVGAHDKPFDEDVKNILVPPMSAFVDMDSKELEP